MSIANSFDSFEHKITNENFFIDNQLKNIASMKTSVLILVNSTLGGLNIIKIKKIIIKKYYF